MYVRCVRKKCLNNIKHRRLQSSYDVPSRLDYGIKYAHTYIDRYIYFTRFECAHIFKFLQVALIWPLFKKHPPLPPHKRISERNDLFVFFNCKLTKAASNELKSTSSLSLQWLWRRLMMIVR